MGRTLGTSTFKEYPTNSQKNRTILLLSRLGKGKRGGSFKIRFRLSKRGLLSSTEDLVIYTREKGGIRNKSFPVLEKRCKKMG